MSKPNNTSSTTSGSAASKLAMRRSSPTPSAASDVSLALKTLDEETMSHACLLLLSEGDYGPDRAETETSDYDKLLSILAKCRQAALVIEQQATSLPLPHLSAAPPSTLATTPSAARAARNNTTTTNTKLPSPSRRLSLAHLVATRGRGAKVAAPVRSTVRPMTREASDASMASAASTASHKKKPKLMTTAVSDKKAPAPPPSALNFLQALNSQEQPKHESKKQQQDDAPFEPNTEETQEGSREHLSRSAKAKGQAKRISPRSWG